MEASLLAAEALMTAFSCRGLRRRWIRCAKNNYLWRLRHNIGFLAGVDAPGGAI
jgi:hypothetical protein